ncbi:hypothetical protein GCM10007301_03620 [Azorhizobium oxalatiphilum]|uniref:Oxidoreductase n=1 Tax=Azorhizobium oxalatiphilum TaxID=980631 RepID=A0A917F658_9HYPH|nr:hypothetical protein [Azorhizobium oxalatiphilum]GGF47570.1 hypothetical protein GCM10007301_03620 [Azorhizobium oxalatiphilum]
MVLWAALCVVCASDHAAAQGSRYPLRVSFVNGAGDLLSEATLDLAGLDRLPQTRVATTTPWTHGVQVFTGPSLAVLARLNTHRVREVRAYSLGDWSATIPASDWRGQSVILASRLNGDTMRVRDKGPYWIMYPIDDRRDLDTQMYQARMIWQVKALEFVVE